MFREMRRKKQQLNINKSIEILEKCKTGILAVLGDNGYPYTIPLNYVYKNNKIYLHSAKEGHKIDALNNYNKVSFCVIEKDDVVPDELTTYFRSVIVFGKAKILKNENDILSAAKILGLKYIDNIDFIEKEIKKFQNSLSCIEIEIENITGKEAIELIKK